MSHNGDVPVVCVSFINFVLLSVVRHLQEILDYIHESEALYIPGVMTPTEVSM